MQLATCSYSLIYDNQGQAKKLLSQTWSHKVSIPKTNTIFVLAQHKKYINVEDIIIFQKDISFLYIRYNSILCNISIAIQA